MDKKRTAAGADWRWAIRGSPCFWFSTLTPHQMWRAVATKDSFVARRSRRKMTVWVSMSIM